MSSGGGAYAYLNGYQQALAQQQTAGGDFLYREHPSVDFASPASTGLQSGAVEQQQLAKRISLFNQSAAPERCLSLLEWRQEQTSDCPMSTARSCQTLFNKTAIPENATDDERRIHQFLDALNINQINIKEYIESKQRIESPNVQKLLNQKKL